MAGPGSISWVDDVLGPPLALEHDQDTGRDGQPRQDLAAAEETDRGHQMQDPRRDEPGAEQEDTRAGLAPEQPHSEPPIALSGPNPARRSDPRSLKPPIPI